MTSEGARANKIHVGVAYARVRANQTMAAVQQGGEENRLSLAQTRLAAEEREALEAIKGDLCQWLGKPDVLALKIDPASFLGVLDSGASLCKLAGLVQEGARASQAGGKKLAVRVPMESLACNTIKAARSSAMFQACARDNTAHFIEWCRMLGVEEAVIFESVGLVEHRDEKRVVLCLLDVARFAEKVGITPPQLVRLEKEIDILEAQLLESTGSEGERTNVGEVSPPEREDADTEDVSRQQSMESEQEVEKEVALDKQGGKSGGVNLVGEEGDNSLQQETREVREKDEAEVREKEEAGVREKGEAEVEEGPPAKKLKTGEPWSRGKTSPERPPAHKHSHGRRLPQGRTTQDKSRPVQPPKQAQRLSPRKEETVDEKVKGGLVRFY